MTRALVIALMFASKPMAAEPYLVRLPDGHVAEVCGIVYHLPPMKVVEATACDEVFRSGFE